MRQNHTLNSKSSLSSPWMTIAQHPFMRHLVRIIRTIHQSSSKIFITKYDNDALNYLTASMPHHHDSFIGVAFSDKLQQNIVDDINKTLQALSQTNFTEANNAYHQLRLYKNSGLIKNYAIANSLAEAMNAVHQKLV